MFPQNSPIKHCPSTGGLVQSIPRSRLAEEKFPGVELDAKDKVDSLASVRPILSIARLTGP